MRTEKQQRASRVNGNKSNGPVTPAGKAVSSRNAERHGLLKDGIVVEGEAEDRFLALHARNIAEHRPQTESERALVETMTASRWRQTRVWTMETAHLSHEIRRQSDSEITSQDAATRASLALESISGRSRVLDLLNRYEARFDRAYYRAKKKLRETRALETRKCQTNLRINNLLPDE